MSLAGNPPVRVPGCLQEKTAEQSDIVVRALRARQYLLANGLVISDRRSRCVCIASLGTSAIFWAGSLVGPATSTFLGHLDESNASVTLDDLGRNREQFLFPTPAAAWLLGLRGCPPRSLLPNCRSSSSTNCLPP